MSPKLSDIFGELGILQYLDVFVDQGFDTWDTILDITESDLDALGVKLGHRRKLQRRIANARGVAPNAVLVSPTRPSVEDAVRNETQRPDVPTLTSSESRDSAASGAPVVQKRKYRRHPKPDENAPERPPSAYVLFSNKMREDLKGQNLTFTEIAKLVGENWQGLTHTEKEPFERQAQTAKEKYNHDLAEYKKTDEYKNYLQYLQDFKAKHGNQSQDKEGSSKRVRLSDSTVEPNGVIHTTSRGMRAGSMGENPTEPAVRRQRIGSIVSNGESYYAPSILSTSQRTPDGDSTVASPNGGYFDRRREHSPSFVPSPRDSSVQPPFAVRKEPSYLEASRNDVPVPTRHLPPLSDMLDNRPLPNVIANSVEAVGSNFAMLPRGHQTHSPAPTSSLSGSESRPPSLRKEQSSAGSISSGSSYNSYPRTPIEGPLPIHALLTGGGKQFGSHEIYGASPVMYRSMSPDDRTPPTVAHLPERTASDPPLAAHALPQLNGDRGIPPPSSAYYNGGPPLPSRVPPYQQHAYSDHRLAPLVTTASASGSRTGKGETGLDGISALLQADKLADRRLD